jgi:aldose sugar dehydrogenase
MRRYSSWTAVVLGALLVVPTVLSGPALARVRARPVARGLNAPVGFTFAPNGSLVYLERHTGWLRFRNLRRDSDRRIYRVPNVNSDGERGALGVALHPRWPDRPFAFVFATRNTSAGVRNQVLRIRIERGRATRVRVILSSPDSATSTNHNGGRIAFGPDGKLYVVIGEDAVPANSQDRSANLRGKILRLDPNGTAARGNPFGNRIWAYGIRNSIGFAFDPFTGRLWEQDNGPTCNDEVNRVPRGANMGWGPRESCPNTNNSGPRPRVRPRFTFADTKGLTGVAFCNACGLGRGFHGDLLVGAVNDGMIRRFDLGARRRGFDRGPLRVLDRATGVLSLEVGPNRRIFFSDVNGVYRLVRR